MHCILSMYMWIYVILSDMLDKNINDKSVRKSGVS